MPSGGAGPNATEYHIFKSVPGTSLSVGVVGSSSFDTDGALTAYEWTLPGMPVWVYEAGALGFGVDGLWRSSSSDTTLEVDAAAVPVGRHTVMLTVTDDHDEPDSAALTLVVHLCAEGLRSLDGLTCVDIPPPTCQRPADREVMSGP